jgi:hypothetical protein
MEQDCCSLSMAAEQRYLRKKTEKRYLWKIRFVGHMCQDISQQNVIEHLAPCRRCPCHAVDVDGASSAAVARGNDARGNDARGNENV